MCVEEECLALELEATSLKNNTDRWNAQPDKV